METKISIINTGWIVIYDELRNKNKIYKDGNRVLSQYIYLINNLSFIFKFLIHFN